MREVDVLVIGAGQAGLAMGYHLKQQKRSFLILGKEERLGDPWRNRYDSLVLFTPRWFSSLPGLPLTGDPNGYSTKDEIANYLEAYAAHFQLPIQLQTEIYSLEKFNGMFQSATSRGEFRAKTVVIATGPFQNPFIPEMAKTVSDNIYQVHTSQYRNPSQLKSGSVLVVGAGNSGAQIAVELCKDREVYLSNGHKLKFFPLQRLGKSIFWWFKQLRMLNADTDSKIGQFIRKRHDPIFGLELRQLLRLGKIRLKPRTVEINGDKIAFADSSLPITVQNIIWATGFVSDYDWVRIPNVIGGNKKPVHNRGVTSEPGLYFLGLPWQQTRGSALIGGVGADAEYLLSRIVDKV